MLADLTAELQAPLVMRVAGTNPPPDHVLNDNHIDGCGDECKACDTKAAALGFMLFIRRLGGNVDEIRFNENGEPDILITWGTGEGQKYQILGPGAAFVGQ